MKKIKYGLLAFVASIVLVSCSNEVVEPPQEGNPTLQVEAFSSNVHFGDRLPFEATVSDDVPLSTLTAVLYFGEEEVSRTTVPKKTAPIPGI